MDRLTHIHILNARSFSKCGADWAWRAYLWGGLSSYEEFMFRYKLNEILEDWKIDIRNRYLITSILFASIHLPQGMISLMGTFIWGLFFFFVYMKSNSIHFVIALHFIADFIVFGIKTLES